MRETKDIPIRAAEDIARKYGYDQIVIIGRAVGPDGREHCTTFGVDKANCDVAAKIGDFIKYKLMRWQETPPKGDAMNAPAPRAYPLEWDGKYEHQWDENRYGFTIAYNPEDEEDYRYFATWGEGPEDTFATLDEAKKWCQETIDGWIAANVII